MGSSILKEELSVLNLSPRAYNGLMRGSRRSSHSTGTINTVEDLLQKTETEISIYSYIGEKTLKEIKECLSKNGLALEKEESFSECPEGFER